MIQPMVYGFPSEYGNDNFSNYFDWSTNNKGAEVMEMITSSNDLSYGIGYASQKEMNTIGSTIDFGVTASVNPWRGGVVHPNGKIYFLPNDDNRIMEYEPISKTVNLWGNVGSTATDKLTGGVLYPDGMIYMMPSAGFSTAYGVIKINPYTKTTTTIGLNVINVNTRGSVVHTNGNIYGVPDRDGVLVFNPRNNDWEVFGAATIGTTATYWGGCLHPNGKIYCPVFTQSGGEGAIEIDVNKKTVKKLPCVDNIVATNSLFNSIVLAPNNLMYGIPCNSEKVIEINPYTQSCRLVGKNLNTLTGASTSKFGGGCLAPDGFIYMMPCAQLLTSAYKFDWKTYNMELTNPIKGLSVVRSGKNRGAFLSFDGCIYGAPSINNASTVQISKVDFGVGVKEGVFCREVNKL